MIDRFDGASTKPRQHRFSSARLSCLGLVFLVLFGCGFKFTYNNLDWLLPWYLKSFVTLTDGQKDYLQATLPGRLEWHRRTQLEEYVVWLERWKGHVNNGVSREQLEQTNQKMQSLFGVLLEQAIPDITHLLSSASDQQIKEIVSRLEQDNLEFASEIEKVSSADYRKQQAESAQETLQGWLGGVSETQENYLVQWSDGFVSVSDQSIVYRDVWLREFTRITSGQRSGEAFQRTIKRLITNPEQDWDQHYVDQLEKNKDLTNTLWLQVLGSLTVAQRKHALVKIDDWQDLLNNLIEH